MSNKPDIGFTGNILHVIPHNDSDEHCTEGNLCSCNPKINMIGIKAIIVHNSFDKREIIEDVKRILNNEPGFNITDSFTELKN